MTSYGPIVAAMRRSRVNATSPLRPLKCGPRACFVWTVRGALAVVIAGVAGCASPRVHAPVAPIVAQSPAKSVPAISAPPLPRVAVLDPRTYEQGKNRIKLALAKNAHDSLAPSEVGYYMDVLQGSLKQVAGKSVTIGRQGDSIVLDLSFNLSFESASAQINPAVREILMPLSKVLMEYRMTLVSVHACADDSGEQTINPRLAELRALTVAHYLASVGVVEKRIVIAAPDLDRAPATTANPENRTHVELHLEPVVRVAVNGQ